MNTFLRLACVATAFGGLVSPSFSQDAIVEAVPPKGAAVVLQIAGTDDAGQQLAGAVKDLLAMSIGFRPATSSDQTYLILSLATVAVSETPGSATAYSAAFQVAVNGARRGRHIGHTVGVCGKNKVSSCASRVLVSMSAALNAEE